MRTRMEHDSARLDRRLGGLEVQVTPNGDPSPSGLTRWEFMSVIIWDDDTKSSVTSDLEDVDVLNVLGLEGWELVCVVPLARTQILEMAYPGNTRKLLAYLKRPLR